MSTKKNGKCSLIVAMAPHFYALLSLCYCITIFLYYVLLLECHFVYLFSGPVVFRTVCTLCWLPAFPSLCHSTMAPIHYNWHFIRQSKSCWSDWQKIVYLLGVHLLVSLVHFDCPKVRK